MAQIARNLSLDKLKSKEYLKNKKTDSIDNVVSGVQLLNFETSFNVDQIGVNKIKDLLRNEEKLIIEYLYFKGYTQQELSDEMEIPIGTIKTRLRMAINNLRKALAIRT
jgi:RNA polymerase sigma-70 factor (ECF subfamily)